MDLAGEGYKARAEVLGTETSIHDLTVRRSSTGESFLASTYREA